MKFIDRARDRLERHFLDRYRGEYFFLSPASLLDSNQSRVVLRTPGGVTLEGGTLRISFLSSRRGKTYLPSPSRNGGMCQSSGFGKLLKRLP
jgi:hypothetical protein